LLFVGQYNGQGRLFSTRDWRPVGRYFEGHGSRVTFAAFPRAGRTPVTSGAAGHVRAGGGATPKPPGSPRAPTPAGVAPVAVPGSHLFAVSNQGPGLRFDLSAADWERHACAVAGHDLSAQEWADALPGRPQHAVCGPITGG